jgi:hypothetical protein
MIGRILRAFLPRGAAPTVCNCRTLAVEFAHYQTSRRWECVEKGGGAIPWYTYPAIEYLRQIDLSEKTVFEYGSGYSTLFWSQRCAKLTAVEDDRKWHERIAARLPDRVQYHFLSDKKKYIQAINQCSYQPDIIVIDGKYRRACASAARSRLSSRGFIILDNSDWHPETSQFLRESDLIEVDMSGFGPINGYTWTTSFYFTRNVELRPACARQPMPGIGASIAEPGQGLGADE